MCSDVAGPSSSGWGDFPVLSLDLSVTTTTILPFGACYVITHKVYMIRMPILDDNTHVQQDSETLKLFTKLCLVAFCDPMLD